MGARQDAAVEDRVTSSIAASEASNALSSDFVEDQENFSVGNVAHRPWFLPVAQWSLDAYLGALTLASSAAPGAAALPIAAGALVGAGAAGLIQKVAFADLRLPARVPLTGLIARAAATSALAGTAVACGAAAMPAAAADATTLALMAVGFALPSGTFRAAAFAARASAARDGAPVRLALIGDEDASASVQRTLSASPSVRCAVVARLSDDGQADLDRLRSLAHDGKLDAVVLAAANRSAERIRAVYDVIADLPMSICLAADPTALGFAALCPDLRAAPRWPHPPLVEVLPAPPCGAASAAKRALDVVVSAAALVLLAPALAAVALAIRLESPGPALFRQWRSGLAGKPVEILKFRTMRADVGDPSGAQHTLARDPRVTRLGRLLRRTSLDELPQLWNVLRGDMSLVGPRPHALAMQVAGIPYADAVPFYRVRHRVRPGMTGWAQVNGSRGEVNTRQKAAQRVRLDLWYVGNWSLALDVQILLRTVLGGFASLRAD